jgi:hypothetical protein
MKSMDSTRLGGIILGLALALALAGCSAVKLGYNALPTLAYWWLDGYLDFSGEQAPPVREALADLQAWHRQQELPRVLALLARMEQLAPGEITPQQACGIAAEGRERLLAVGEHAAAGAATLAAQLTDRELRHLTRKFGRNNERFENEWVALPPAERQDKRFHQMLKRLETLYGRLDAPQRAVLRERVEQSVYDPQRFLAESQRRQQDLLQVLHRLSAPGGAPEPEARALVRGWLERVEKSPDPGHRAYQEALLQENCASFATVHRSTTASQRAHAQQRLRAYQHDLRDLMAQQP